MRKTDHSGSGYQWMVPGEKEKKSWDKLVMQDPAGNVYMLSWYLDIVAPGKWGLVTNEKLTAGMPLAFKKRTGYRNIYQPFYTMFFDALGGAQIDALLETVTKEYHHIHFTTQSSPGIITAAQRTRQEMPMSGFLPSLYSENASRQIKKAIKHQLVFSLHNNAPEVVRLFRDNKGAELKEYKAADFKILERLIKKSIEKEHGFCAQVRAENQVLASGFFLTFGNRIIFLKGGVSDEGKKQGAMYLLMHRVIEMSKEKYTVFDFGGSNNRNVAEFYRKLGGKDLSYHEIKIDRRNVLHKVIGKLRK